MDLLKELLQVCPTFVIYPRIGEKTTSIATFKNTDTEVDIFPEAHFRESPQSFIHFATNPHIEATRIKLVHLLFSATDTACCKKGSHRVVDSFLNIRKRIVRTVGTTERVGRRSLKLLLYRVKISFGQNDIRVQYDKIFSFASLRSVVTGLPRSGIGFREILDVQPICIPICHFLTRDGRTIFNNNYFKIFKTLYSETLQQFIHLIGTIVNGNYDRIAHINEFIK